MVSAAAGLIHLVAAFSHFEESALHGAFFVGTGLAQLVVAGLLVYQPRSWLLIATAAGNGLILAIWLMSRTTGIPVEPHAWTPEPVGIPDGVASFFELGLVIGALLLLVPSGGSLLAQANPRKPHRWLVPAASIIVLITGPALLSAARGEEHSHASVTNGSSSQRESATRASRSVAPASMPSPQADVHTGQVLTVPAAEARPPPAPPPPPAAVDQKAPPLPALPEPSGEIEPPVETGSGESGTHTHEGEEHEQHQ
jgi:hypothetical protein